MALLPCSEKGSSTADDASSSGDVSSRMVIRVNSNDELYKDDKQIPCTKTHIFNTTD